MRVLWTMRKKRLRLQELAAIVICARKFRGTFDDEKA